MAIDLVLFVCMRRDLFPTALCNAARLGLLATLLPASAFTAFAADPYTLFAPGMTKDSGWYDVNKKSTASTPTQDYMYCWAAVASNMIQHWQDCYVASGRELPANIPNGKTSSRGYELGIFDTFLDNWTGSGGGDPHVGIEWYFTGNGHTFQNYAKPNSNTGGYWSSEYASILDDLGTGFIAEELHCYSGWEYAQGGALKEFSRLVTSYLSGGSAGIVIQSGFLHAITLWGAEVDALGIVTAVYVTDSDDADSAGAIVSPLRKYAVSEGTGERKINLVSTDYGTVGVTHLYGLTAYPIPEPSMFGALAGVFALGLAATRRKLRRPRGA